MTRFIALVGLAIVASAHPTHAQSAADSAGIRQTALDYIEGWYTGDAARMERALHPDLAKRIVNVSKSGESTLGQMGASTLIDYTRRGGGQRTPADKQRKDVRILDIFGNAANVRVDAANWVDYLQVGKLNGRWLIINVLWEERR